MQEFGYVKSCVAAFLLISTLVIVSVAFTTGAHADASCGQGKIEEIVEGGWNFDDLMIKLSSSPTGATGLWFGYVRYQGFCRKFAAIWL